MEYASKSKAGDLFTMPGPAFAEVLDAGPQAVKWVQRAIEAEIRAVVNAESPARPALERLDIQDPKTELQRDIGTDAMYMVRDLPRTAPVLETSFRGEPTGVYFQNSKSVVPIVKTETETMVKPLCDFMAYEFPVAIIAQNMARDLIESESRRLRVLLEAAVTQTGKFVYDADGYGIDGLQTAMRLHEAGRPLRFLVGREAWGSMAKTALLEVVPGDSDVIMSNVWPEIWIIPKDVVLGPFVVVQDCRFAISVVNGRASWVAWTLTGMNLDDVGLVARYSQAPTSPPLPAEVKA